MSKPYSKEAILTAAITNKVSYNQICCICLKVITMQIFKNTGVCCENHRKDRDNDHEVFRAVNIKV